MVNNKKGQVAFVFLMLGIVIVIFGLSIAKPTSEIIQQARQNNTANSIGLDCQNAAISDFQQAQCVVTDMTLPYFVLSVIFIGVIAIGIKLIGGGG